MFFFFVQVGNRISLVSETRFCRYSREIHALATNALKNPFLVIPEPYTRCFA